MFLMLVVGKGGQGTVNLFLAQDCVALSTMGVAFSLFLRKMFYAGESSSYSISCYWNV
jgi:hypothetical protein